MKIHIDNVNFSSTSGPNTFGTRLAKAFIECGHDIEEDGTSADVSLVFIERSGKKLSKKVVQRLDGIWFKPENFLSLNTNIKSLYESADAVVWQSEFDSLMTKKWWKEPKLGRVIHNGITPYNANKQIDQNVSEIRNKTDLLFVCSANWHAQKRLLDNIKLFEKITIDNAKLCCRLVVLGNNPDVRVYNSNQVLYAGSQSEEIYMQLYSVADWMIHLAWLDHCPNVVIEALSVGLPVIHSSDGGTKEIVKNFGVMINDTNQYNFELVDYDNPPRVNFSTFNLPNKSSMQQKPDVSMDTCVKSYIELFGNII